MVKEPTKKERCYILYRTDDVAFLAFELAMSTRAYWLCLSFFFSLPRWGINDQEPGIKSNVQLDFISKIGFSLPSPF